MSKLLPKNISQFPSMYALEVLVEQRFRKIEIDKLLIKFFDTVDPGLLDVLAEDLDVLGLKGWDFADTEEKKRELLRKAIQLKRYRGTPWAIEEAVKLAGFTDFQHLEGTGGHWAKFRIMININSHYPNAEQIEKAIKLIKLYKRGTAVLEGLYFYGLTIDDNDAFTLDDSDLLVNGATDFTDSIATDAAIVRDGTILRDGTQNYTIEADCINLKQV